MPTDIPPPDLLDKYDQAYREALAEPKLNNLVYLCYKTPDYFDNAQRFFSSQEFSAEIELLTRCGFSAKKVFSILDFGCGNGVASWALAKSGYTVIGIDSSLGTLAGLHAAKKLQNYENVCFDIRFSSSQQKIDFEDSSFDIFWMRSTLHHISDFDFFFNEVKRILKPGGIMVALRDHVVWNESQKKDFFLSHQMSHIIQDENCHYLLDYVQGITNSGLQLIVILSPTDSAINAYPSNFTVPSKFNVSNAVTRQKGNDLFSFVARKGSQT